MNERLTDEEIDALWLTRYSLHDGNLILRLREFARAVLARAAVPVVQPQRALPNPGSAEASAMMDSLLAEYNWPANTKNAARAGGEAANRWLVAAPQARQEPKPDSVYPVQPSSEAATWSEAAKDNAVLQARCWAAEARGHRATVLAILRYFGLPERDYEALTLIQEKDAEHRAAMLNARDALQSATAGLEWYRDHCPDQVNGSDDEADQQIGEALAALEGVLRTPAQASTAVQRHITDMLVAHRDMIEAQQRGDSAAEVLAVQRMEAARSAIASAARPRPVAFHDKDQPNGIAWCPGYPEGLKDITPLYADHGAQEPRAVTPTEDAVLRRAAMRSAKVVSSGVPGPDGGQR